MCVVHLISMGSLLLSFWLSVERWWERREEHMLRLLLRRVPPMFFDFWWHIPLLLFTALAQRIMRVCAALTYVMASVRRGGGQQWSRRGRRGEWWAHAAALQLFCTHSAPCAPKALCSPPRTCTEARVLRSPHWLACMQKSVLLRGVKFKFKKKPKHVGV